MAARARLLTRIGASTLALAWLAGCAGSVSLDEPLEGTPWRLVQIGGQPVDGGFSLQTEPRIRLDADAQRMTGSGGCNALSGNFRRNSGSALRIGPVLATRRACADPGLNALETRFIAALDATAGYSLKGAQLTLLDARGLPLAVLEPGLREPPR
ncbi:MAG: META domain-containing protein [Comamonadaceae bacterium]|nr:MAG: META domain-containing protein [Comamonadaceae bacterium]